MCFFLPKIGIAPTHTTTTPSTASHMSRQYILSSLQKKGVLVLSLLLVAESVTFSNALKLWTNYEAFLDETTSGKRSRTGNFFKFKEDIFGKQKDQCSNAPPAVSAIGTITTTTTKSQGMIKSKLLSPLVKLSDNVKNRFGDDCCRRCSQYMEPSKALEQCGVIRGGHSAAQHAAEKVADAMAQGGSEVTPYGIPLHLWKIIFQAILTTINVACWLLPLRSKKMSENKLGLSLANAFSGGVFLSLAFGHLIPECVHGFADYQEVTPYMLVLAGYLLIFFVEKVSHKIVDICYDDAVKVIWRSHFIVSVNHIQMIILNTLQVAFDSHSILHEIEHAGEHKHADGGNKANGEVDAPQVNGSRSAVILLGALAVHSILEMMALGLADSFGDCALLTLSIALHQVR